MKRNAGHISKIVIRKVAGGTNIEVESGGSIKVERFAGRVAAKKHAFALSAASGAPVWNVKQGGGMVLCA